MANSLNNPSFGAPKAPNALRALNGLIATNVLRAPNTIIAPIVPKMKDASPARYPCNNPKMMVKAILDMLCLW